MVYAKKMFILSTFFYISTISLSGCSTFSSEVKNMKTHKKEIIEVANKKAEELGYTLKAMIIIMDEDNAVWNDYISKGSFFESEYGKNLDKKLRDRKYWAVYYKPKRIQLGGDLFVFIDRDTKKVTTVLQGQ